MTSPLGTFKKSNGKVTSQGLTPKGYLSEEQGSMNHWGVTIIIDLNPELTPELCSSNLASFAPLREVSFFRELGLSILFVVGDGWKSSLSPYLGM